MSLDQIMQDRLCYDLADFLANNLNATVLEDFPELRAGYSNQVVQDTKIVKSIRSYDDPYVPIDEFPLLKVYRLQDVYNNRNPYFIKTQVNINYACSFAQVRTLSGLTVYVARNLINGLHLYTMGKQYDLPPDFTKGIQVRHATGYNNLINAIHPFVNLTAWIMVESHIK